MSHVLKLSLLSGSIFLATACGVNTTSNSKLTDQFSGTSFFYMDKTDRAELVSEIYNQVKSNYALWGIKKARLGIDGDKVFTDAIEAEKAIADVTGNERDEAKANLDTLDRLQQTIAKLQDTHFGFKTANPRKYINYGFEVAEAEGKVTIISKRDQVWNYAKLTSRVPEIYDYVSIGDEIVSIDAIPVEEYINKLIPFISASSPAYARREAIAGLVARDFYYPTSGYSDFEINSKKAGGVLKIRVPVYMNSAPSRKDSTTYLEDMGVKALSELRTHWDAKANKWALDPSFDTSGYAMLSAPKNLKDEKVYVNSEGNNFNLRTGYFIRKGKTYAYLQLADFMAENIMLEGEKNAQPFFDVLEKFVLETKENETPLIFDLRDNGGGNGSYPAKILSIFARADDAFASPTRSWRITRQIRQLTEAWGSGIPNVEPAIVDFDLFHFEVIKKAIQARSEYTDVIATVQAITANQHVGGYTNKMVVLISPNCISACDMQSILFKTSKRATLIGTQANGTGAGFTSTDSLGSKDWEDDFQVSSLKVPNFLFGLPGELGKTVFSEENAALKYTSENVPTEADVKYDYTSADYLDKSSGWMTKAMDTLDAE